MKVVILAGGLGTRLSEETGTRPKPMVEIGGKPILWHIMKIYSHYGFHDFVICAGYKGHIIKEYFMNYLMHQSDISIDVKGNQVVFYPSDAEPWKVTVADTGDDSMTGGRIGRIKKYIQDDSFLLTYGDGVGNINIPELIQEHHNSGAVCTLTAVRPGGRFGVLDMDDHSRVRRFNEKPSDGGVWINGGFFVCNHEVFDLIENDQTIWERGPLETLAQKGQLHAFKHEGFWRPMDTLKDKNDLNELWNSGLATWKIWT